MSESGWLVRERFEEEREKGETIGPKRKRREREGSKVRVLGFKNAYRLERVSRIKD